MTTVTESFRLVNGQLTGYLSPVVQSVEKPSKIQQRIIESRTKLGISQTKLAEMVGVVRNTVSSWEGGRNKPEDDKMIKVAASLGVSISYLYGETDDPRPAPQWGTSTGPSSRIQSGLMNIRSAQAELLGKIDELIAAEKAVQDGSDSQDIATEPSPPALVAGLQLQKLSPEEIDRIRNYDAYGRPNPDYSQAPEDLKVARKFRSKGK